MGEGSAERPTKQRYTVAEAARILDLSAEAVRSRIKRGTLESVKEGSTVYVPLSPDQTTDQTPPGPQPNTDQSHPDTTALISRLEDEVRFLREELTRKDAILLRMAESIPQLEAPREARESPESPGPRETPFTDEETPQEGSERRWWEFWR